MPAPRTALSAAAHAGGSAFHRPSGTASWRPAPLLPDGESHDDNPPAGGSSGDGGTPPPPNQGTQGGDSGDNGGSGTNDRGFPENTPWRDMAPEQQVAYWQHQARKHESTAKSRADYDALRQKAEQFDQIQREQMTPSERALEDARREARESALREAATTTVAAYFAAEAAGRSVNGQPLDVDGFLEDVDLSKYLTDDGKPDRDRIKQRLDRFAPAGTPATGRWPDMGQGRREAPPARKADAGIAEAQRRYKKQSADA